MMRKVGVNTNLANTTKLEGKYASYVMIIEQEVQF